MNTSRLTAGKKLADQSFHFVGIGGIGMCGLAELLHNMGAKVSGSDLVSNPNTEKLARHGVLIHVGHRAENVRNSDVVVYSSAIKDSNVELVEARSQRIPVIPRAEALAEIMRLKRGIAIGGTHGKTTTTSMTASIFLAGNLDPTIAVGGIFDLIKSTALLGKGDWMIAEADESDGSFQKLSPEIAVITNIDSDHLDYFKSFAELEKAFLGFAQKIPFYGWCIACGDDAPIRKVLKDFTKRVIYYGFSAENDFILQGEKGQYILFEGEKKLGSFELAVPGKHNALNAAAAIVVGLHAGLDFPTCRKGLLMFQGVDRRFHFKGTINDITVYDDYGHHPTEIRATLSAFREKYPDRRLVVLFQPHRYSRTQHCWHEFTRCFSQCDELLITDIYPAGEPAIAEISSEKLTRDMSHDHCHYLPKRKEISKDVASYLKKDDIFVTLGAGDVYKIGMQILENKK